MVYIFFGKNFFFIFFNRKTFFEKKYLRKFVFNLFKKILIYFFNFFLFYFFLFSKRISFCDSDFCIIRFFCLFFADVFYTENVPKLTIAIMTWSLLWCKNFPAAAATPTAAQKRKKVLWCIPPYWIMVYILHIYR